ncbi:MAG: hypothetical protein M5R42_10045 [Rhodocyclaceae bacterium]|nr:hypothetical protein [Rhodocyclaceae bacterium]
MSPQLVRVRDVGHLRLVLQARLSCLEGRCQVEDLLAVLDGDHAPAGEAAAIARAVHLVVDRRGRIPGLRK